MVALSKHDTTHSAISFRTIKKNRAIVEEHSTKLSYHMMTVSSLSKLFPVRCILKILEQNKV